MSLSIQQLRGLKDLIQEGVTAGVNAAAETHQAIVRKPFALLEQIRSYRGACTGGRIPGKNGGDRCLPDYPHHQWTRRSGGDAGVGLAGRTRRPA